MEQVLLVFYVLLSVAIVALILLQQGKGADVGASFGAGASQTVFGSGGAGNALTRGTAILATIFFIASIGLAVMARHKAEAARDAGIPVPAALQSGDNAPPAGDLPVGQVPGDVPVAPAAEDIPTGAASDVPAAPAAEGSAAASSEDIPAGQ